MEIPVTNQSRAQKFYNTVFGWEFKAATDVAMTTPESYSMFSKPGTKLCGGMPLVKEELLQPKIEAGEATVRVVMKVEEVTAALKTIEAAGGKTIREKQEIGSNMGYSGQFRDTEGNINGVWSMN